MKQGDVLTKYDEELGGPKRSSFRLGTKGQAMLDDDELKGLGEKQRRLARLKQLHTLSATNNQLVPEYMTTDEASTAFRKPKKMRKKKKKKMLTADDLEPIDDGEVHHGSRASRGLRVIEGEKVQEEEVEPGEVVSAPTKSLRELMEEDDDEPKKMDVDDNDYNNDDLDDDFELQEALANSRKAKLAKEKQPKLEDIRDMLDSNEPASSSVSLSELLDDNKTDNLAVTLNTTDEFCRTLGDIPTYGLSGNRAFDEEQVSAVQLQNTKPAEEPASVGGAWEEVGIDDTKVEIAESLSVPILDEEPDASSGVGNTLKLAIKKGYLEKDQQVKTANAALQHLRAVNYSIDDKAGDDDRRGRGGGDRYASGPITDFREKDNYKPKINLQYVDDEGRKLCPKEAFR